MPLVDRVSALKIPVTFVYGQHDWMDPEGGLRAVEKLKEAGNRHAKMVIVPDAGHHGKPPFFASPFFAVTNRDFFL